MSRLGQCCAGRIRSVRCWLQSGAAAHRVSVNCWLVDETYVRVRGRWRYLYRAIEQYGQVVDVFLREQRDLASAEACFEQAIQRRGVTPATTIAT